MCILLIEHIQVTEISHSLTKGAITSIAVSSDNQYLFSGSDDNYIKIWDCTQAKCIHTLANAHYGAITGLVITDDSEYLVSSGLESSIKVWRL